MNIGDIIYLCENEFAKFREIYENIKRGPHCHKMKNVKIENRFVLLKPTIDDVFYKNLSDHIGVSFENKDVDFNFFNCVETVKFENIKYSLSSGKLPNREMIFIFPQRLLTVIK